MPKRVLVVSLTLVWTHVWVSN